MTLDGLATRPVPTWRSFVSDSVHVLGICGSLRRGSYNAALLRAASELLPPGMTLTIHDLRSIPLFDGDVEAAGLPASVTALQSAIREADGVLIATPEYNYSTPGVLKNSIDWVSRGKNQPLGGKPVALMGASAGGFATVRSQLALRQVLLALDARDLQRPEVHVANAGKLVSPEGVLTDEGTREKIRAMLAAFALWIRPSVTA